MPSSPDIEKSHVSDQYLLTDYVINTPLFSVPVTEAWRDELRALSEAAGLRGLHQHQPRRESDRPRTTQYSAETGRLIPPPSRAMSRQGSRAGRRDQFMNHLQHISEEPDSENMVSDS